MKQQLKKLLMAAFVLLAINATAQSKEETAPWASGKGYWVVETNVKTPLEHTIRFYTNDDALIYTEKIDGVRFNANKKKTKMKLKEVLETTIMAWERNKQPEMGKNYVMAALK